MAGFDCVLLLFGGGSVLLLLLVPELLVVGGELEATEVGLLGGRRGRG